MGFFHRCFLCFSVALVLCDISPCWLCLCYALVWYLSTKVHSFLVYGCLFWVVEWCKCLIWSIWRTFTVRFDARNFLPLWTLLLRKKKTSSMEAHRRCLPRDSTEEAVFRSCNVNGGRNLLPWNLTEDIFRELPRKKLSSVVVMSSARFHGRRFLLLLTLQLQKTSSSVEAHGRCLPWDSTERAILRSCNVHSGRHLLSWINLFYNF